MGPRRGICRLDRNPGCGTCVLLYERALGHGKSGWHESRSKQGVVTMLRLGPGQRALLAVTLAEAANIAVGALLFGQFLGDRPFSPAIGALSLVLWAILVWASLALSGEKSGEK